MPKIIDRIKLKKQAEELASQGLSITEIARVLGSNRPMIYKVLDKNLIYKESEKLKEKIIKYNAMGLNMIEIAKLCNVSKQYIHEILNKEK